MVRQRAHGGSETLLEPWRSPQLTGPGSDGADDDGGGGYGDESVGRGTPAGCRHHTERRAMEDGE